MSASAPVLNARRLLLYTGFAQAPRQLHFFPAALFHRVRHTDKDITVLIMYFCASTNAS